MNNKPSDSKPEGVVDTIQEAVGTIVKREGDVISRYVAVEQDNIDVSGEAAHAEIIAEILASASIDELLNLPQPEDIKLYIGQELEWISFRMRESDFPTGAPIYFCIHARDVDSGKRILINCGDQGLMAQLYRAQQLELFPFKAIPMASERPNKNGGYPVRLTRRTD